ncbi:unnamed protein product [Parnassius apollo]|uniref:(apollo) hypothetical protein n=1 Tax=Parnassius apollo TaxID=110799 RepID=A0A8S3XEA7_PARAO|nr:unnamed protein product [Parnassius apollo]
MIELEMQIEQLKQTLQAANTEVDNLILQNNDLQRELENCQMKELENLKIEKNRIQHKLLELETLTKLKISTKVQKKQEIIHKQENYSSKLQGKGNKIETSERDRAQSGKRKENTKTLTRIEMFSDRIGSGLAIKLMQQLENTKITNYCQTGGNHKQILKHFDLYTKDLKENDLAVILIGNYDIKMGTSYVDEIRRIVSKENRKFNILLGSIIYDNINDDKTFTINKELFNLATI